MYIHDVKEGDCVSIFTEEGNYTRKKNSQNKKTVHGEYILAEEGNCVSTLYSQRNETVLVVYIFRGRKLYREIDFTEKDMRTESTYSQRHY